MVFAWNWLSVPYLACGASLLAVAIVAALVRGDRVLRLGSVGAATAALPWALCSGVATWTEDPVLAERLLRLGNGPLALVGPALLLVLLGVSGQLERHRWIARIAAMIGIGFLATCWSTDLVVSGVHELPSGIYYINPGPLSIVYYLQIAVWLVVGMVIVRRSTSGGERRRLQLLPLGVLALGTLSASDLLLVYDIAGVYPIAWLCTMAAALLALRFELKTDLLRPQGFDRGVFIELLGYLITVTIIAALVLMLDETSPLVLAVLASAVWIVALAITWAMARDQPVRIARERALEEMVAALGDVDGEPEIAELVRSLWREVAIEVRALHRVEGATLVDVDTGIASRFDPEVAAWLVEFGELLAAGDLGTMRVGDIRPKLEAEIAARGATLLVPLVDRGSLVGLVEADHGNALREDERGLVAESARAAARALTYATLSRAAALENETAREVEVAEAMRLQASASRDAELGRWTVAAEYRTAARTTGAGWSASLLADGRLAVLVTEAQAHGVAAALATATLTGAFAAATSTVRAIGLEDLIASLRASSEGVLRGGEPVAAFVAILDGEAQAIQWAVAGHPGATIVGPVAFDIGFPAGSVTGPRPLAVSLGGGGARLGTSLVVATRGEAAFSGDSLLVIASTAVRDDDEAQWHRALSEQAPAGARLASVLVEAARRAGEPSEDLLAVVVRERAP